MKKFLNKVVAVTLTASLLMPTISAYAWFVTTEQSTQMDTSFKPTEKLLNATTTTQAIIDFQADIAYSEYLLKDTGITMNQMLDSIDKLSKIPNLQSYLTYFETELARSRTGSGTVVKKTADQIRNSKDYAENPKDYADMHAFLTRIENSSSFASSKVGTGNAELLKKETIYMYLSHYIDRTSAFDPVNNPIDDNHYATYLTRFDRQTYDNFMGALQLQNGAILAGSVISTGANLKKLVNDGVETAKGIKEMSGEVLVTSDKAKQLGEKVVGLGSGVKDFVDDGVEFLTNEMVYGNGPALALKNLEDSLSGKALEKELKDYILNMTTAMMTAALFSGMSGVLVACATGVISTMYNMSIHVYRDLFRVAATLALRTTLSSRKGYRMYLKEFGVDLS